MNEDGTKKDRQRASKRKTTVIDGLGNTATITTVRDETRIALHWVNGSEDNVAAYRDGGVVRQWARQLRRHIRCGGTLGNYQW
jgi:hypothetical protein